MTSDYNTRDAYDLYVYYLAIRRHFTSNYDFIKYNGKVKANVTSFDNRKDKFFFYKLSKKKHSRDLIFANVIVNPTVWIGDLLDESAENVYNSWKKRKESLTYSFESDIKNFYDDFNSNFIVEEGQHPYVLKLYMMNKISLETLTILVDLIDCMGYWEKNISDTVVFPTINKRVAKYKPFLRYDKVKLTRKLKSHFE